jgi:hypothetical protein
VCEDKVGTAKHSPLFSAILPPKVTRTPSLTLLLTPAPASPAPVDEHAASRRKGENGSHASVWRDPSLFHEARQIDKRGSIASRKQHKSIVGFYETSARELETEWEGFPDVIRELLRKAIVCDGGQGWGGKVLGARLSAPASGIAISSS